MTTTTIWYLDPRRAFLDATSMTQIIPDPDASIESQMNAAMRFCVYLGALVAVARNSIAPALYIWAIGAAVTIGIIYHDRSGKHDVAERMAQLRLRRNAKDGEICSEPTEQNPFMNVLVSDYSQFPERPKACDITDPQVSHDADTIQARNLQRDPKDTYASWTGSARQFYTMPSTTIPNDQSAFANWLYRSSDVDGVCRDGNQVACGARVFSHRPNL